MNPDQFDALLAVLERIALALEAQAKSARPANPTEIPTFLAPPHPPRQAVAPRPNVRT